MIVLWLLVILAFAVPFGYGLEIYCNRHPLTADEVAYLAKKRRRARALAEYRFCTIERFADPSAKKAMKAAGEFVPCDLDYSVAPSRIAGLLKGKKHEWIVIAFVAGKRVFKLWWNKGPDSTRVWSFLQGRAFEQAIQAFRPDAVAILHNHPNSDPSRYRMDLPSDADLNSAAYRHQQLLPRGVSLLEFICERGIPYLYYAEFADNVVPVQPIIAQIQSINGTGVFMNYRLRKEMKSHANNERRITEDRITAKHESYGLGWAEWLIFVPAFIFLAYLFVVL